MNAINVYFDGPPGRDPVKYLGVFDDAGNPLQNEEWTESEPGKWALRIVPATEEDDIFDLWEESYGAKFMRIWRQQCPSFSFWTKLGNVCQSMRNSAGF